jgi:hypothetical protein
VNTLLWHKITKPYNMHRRLHLWILFLAFFSLHAGNTPTITVSTSSTTYIDLGNKSASAVLNDPTDPMLTLGIDFTITDEDPSTVTFTCSSNKTSVVPNVATNLIVSGTGTTRNLKIKAKALGYASITITIKDKEGKTATYTLKYAVSAAALNPSQNHFFTHLSSASTGIAVGDDVWIGDDEYNELSLYNRKQSGMPLATYDPTASLNLPEPDAPEVDIEASCKSPSIANRVYWMGSMSNSKSGEQKPNRDRLFATDLTGADASSKLSVVGYVALRAQIVAWGNSYGYNLTASTKTGVIPKQIDGFSLEGMEFAPDQKTLYLGFRTPFVPTTKRTKALICPLLNFETWFNGGAPKSNASFGTPIELDLGGRGVRSMGKNANNEYIIVAGAFDGTQDFALFRWTGLATDIPVRYMQADLSGLNPEGIVEVPNSLPVDASIELINDNGTADWYNDDTESKDLSTFEFQKFATTWVALDATVTDLAHDDGLSNAQELTLYPNPTSGMFHLRYWSEKMDLVRYSVQNYTGQYVLQQYTEVSAGLNDVSIDCRHLGKGLYYVQIEGRGETPLKLVIE